IVNPAAQLRQFLLGLLPTHVRLLQLLLEGGLRPLGQFQADTKFCGLSGARLQALYEVAQPFAGVRERVRRLSALRRSIGEVRRLVGFTPSPVREGVEGLYGDKKAPVYALPLLSGFKETAADVAQEEGEGVNRR